jgi:hypothetical protein
MSEAEVLRPGSPRWPQFIEQLESMIALHGCDGARGETVHRRAKLVMCNMGCIDIDASLAYFEENGGYCDCEILLNVDRDWSWLEFSESRVTESRN